MMKRPAVVAIACACAAACAGATAARPASTPAGASAWSAVLADSLVTLGREDQNGRDALGEAAARGDTATLLRSLRADSARSRWLRSAVQARGWPLRAAVGDSAAAAAWLILQHSPLYDWQEEMLPTLESLAARGELRPADLALFTDRVLVHRHQPQRYGSQFDMAGGRLVAFPIANLAQVDSLRATVGLPPMAEYVRMLGELYNLPVVWPPAPR